MCLTNGLRHNQTWEAQLDNLRMYRTIYGSSIPTTKYSYFKMIGFEGENIEHHFYCEVCDTYLGKKEELEEEVLCACGETIKVNKSNSFFVTVGLKQQLERLLLDQEIANSMLTYRFTRNKMDANNLEDIYDGKLYRGHVENDGILSSAYNFSYSIFTDGISAGDSSHRTIWPIYILMNELPPLERKKNILLAALYVGTKDPCQQVFLKPFVDQANMLSSEGVHWMHKEKDVSLFIPLCFLADSGCRWSILNMSGYAAYYGCTFCYFKCVHVKEGCRYPISETKIPERTATSTVADMVIAFQQRHLPVKERVYKGVKGPAAIMNLKYFQLIRGFPVDYMHNVLTGVIRLHTELIFSANFKKFWLGMDDSIGREHLINAVDEKLIKFRPPKSIVRLPRGLKFMQLWKCNEWRTWLLYYMVPCLSGLLQSEYLEHMAMLSCAIYILLGSSISPDNDLKVANDLILNYVFLFNEFFKVENMVYNVHLLLHIIRGVKDFGPLWTHNCFAYESYNGHLLKLYASPNEITVQIVRKFLIYASFPITLRRMTKNPKVFKHCEEILMKQLKHFVRGDACTLIGAGKCYSLTKAEEELLALQNVGSCNVLSFEKVITQGARFTVANYSKGKNNNDSLIFLFDGRVGLIEKILKFGDSSVYLLVNELVLGNNLYARHIIQAESVGNIFVAQPKDIKYLGIFLEVIQPVVNAQPKVFTYVSPIIYGALED